MKILCVTWIGVVFLTGIHSSLTHECCSVEYDTEKKHVTALPGCSHFLFLSCDSENGFTDGRMWYLQSRTPAKYPYSGFCRAMSTTDPQTRGSYSIRMDLLGVHGCDSYGCGHPGFLFNAQDPFTFEYIVFRPHAPSKCYKHGYYQNGKRYELASAPCRNGAPKMHTWFTVQMRVVSHSKTVSLYRDGGLVAEIQPHFPATRWGGALTVNAYQDLTAFKNYKLTTI